MKLIILSKLRDRHMSLIEHTGKRRKKERNVLGQYKVFFENNYLFGKQTAKLNEVQHFSKNPGGRCHVLVSWLNFKSPLLCPSSYGFCISFGVIAFRGF